MICHGHDLQQHIAAGFLILTLQGKAAGFCARAEHTEAGFRLFRERYPWTQPVRAVCIRASELSPAGEDEQLSLFIDNEKRARRERLEDTIEELRGRFGKGALTYAVLLGNLKMPVDGRDKVRMPGLMYQ